MASDSGSESVFVPEWKEFLNEVSVGGVKYTIRTEANVLRKVIWALLVIFGLGFALYQITTQIIYFAGNPTTTIVSVNNGGESFSFPTVTICNENILSLSAANAIDPSGNLSRFANDALSTLESPSLDEFHTDFKLPAHMSDWSDYFQQIFVNITNQVKHCRFMGETCTEDMYRVHTTWMGKCFQFNPYGNLTLTEIGLSSGLEVVLNCEQHDYLLTASGSAGYRVNIHNFHDQPSMDVDSFLVNVNHVNDIQIFNEVFDVLPAPYGECNDTNGYLFNGCHEACLDSYIKQQCNCTIPIFATVGVCDPYSLFTCASSAIGRFSSEQIITRDCSCPKQCHEEFFQHSISTAQFSDHYIRSMLSFLQNERGLNLTTEDIKSDLVDLEIYYTELASLTFSEQPAYGLTSLLCDVGGAMGLILGSTVLTMFEFGDFLLVIMWRMFKGKNRVKNDEVKILSPAEARDFNPETISKC